MPDHVGSQKQCEHWWTKRSKKNWAFVKRKAEIITEDNSGKMRIFLWLFLYMLQATKKRPGPEGSQNRLILRAQSPSTGRVAAIAIHWPLMIFYNFVWKKNHIRQCSKVFFFQINRARIAIFAATNVHIWFFFGFLLFSVVYFIDTHGKNWKYLFLAILVSGNNRFKWYMIHIYRLFTDFQ